MIRTISEGTKIFNSFLRSSMPTAIPYLCPLMLLRLLLLLQNWNCRTKILLLFKQIKHGCIHLNSGSGSAFIGLSQFKSYPEGCRTGLVTASGREKSLRDQRDW